MPLYFLRVSLSHPTFRIPSLLSIADLYGFTINFISEDKFRSILIIELEKEEYIERLLDRGIVIQYACRLYGYGNTYEQCHDAVKQDLSVFDEDMYRSFKVTIESSNHAITGSRHRDIVESFRFIDLKGRIDLKNPEVELVVFEDYDAISAHSLDMRLSRDGHFHQVYFGRKIGNSRARHLINAHSVKTRSYYGNTSMEAEMGFLLAGQALPAPGKIIYDPFAGTGSLLYAAAHWGAYVLGSDIDGRQMRGKQGKGKGSVPGVLRAAQQYGVMDQFWDCLTFDVTRGPWRRGGWVDGIVTDPPYGVRAGAKRLGKKDITRNPLREEPYKLPDGSLSHLQPDYVPPFRPYELSNLTLDLIHFARWILVPRGRLVFFLPTVTEEWDEVDIPIVEGMREIKEGDGSVQDFGKWGRRLITMEKTAEDDGPPPTFLDHDDLDAVQGRAPGHRNFNKKYFSGFAPSTGETMTATEGVRSSEETNTIYS